jgi:hypothetical protein
MKKIFFLLLAVISFNCIHAQDKKTSPKQDTVAVQAPLPQPEQPKVLFIVGTEQNFQFLESIVLNFKGLSYLEIKPLLDWLAARRELPQTAPPAEKK